MKAMNEKEFLRDIISHEHGTRALSMSAEDVLSVRRSAVAGRNSFALPAVLAAVTVTAAASGGALLLWGIGGDNPIEADDIKPSASVTTTVTYRSDPQTSSAEKPAEKTTVTAPVQTSLPVKKETQPTTTTVTVPPSQGGIIKPGDDIPTTDRSVLIQDYDHDENETYSPPENGTVKISSALAAAADRYADTVRYRVYVEVYQDGKAVTDNEKIAALAQKLYTEYGITTARETNYSNGITQCSFLTAHGDINAVKSFPKLDGYGFILLLYNERVPSSAPAIPAAYN